MLSRAPIHTPISQEFSGDQILQIESFLSDLDKTNPQHDIPVFNQTYSSIKESSRTHPELQTVQHLVMEGWLSKPSEVPDNIRAYFYFHDKLATLDEVVYKGPQLVIPLSYYRPTKLKTLHLSHQGITATLRRARFCMYWSQMANDITHHINQCFTCAVDAPSQQRGTFQNHDTPATVWSKVQGIDLFTYRNQEYLVTLDYLHIF